MNKYLLFICVLLSLKITIQFELAENVIGTIYDKAIVILKGMSENNYSCYDILENNKTLILPVVMEIISLYKKNPGSIVDFNKLIELMAGMGDLGYELIEDCDILKLYHLYLDLNDDEKRITIVEQFGRNITENINLLYYGSSNFVKVRGIDSKLELLGKIIRAITNITFY